MSDVNQSLPERGLILDSEPSVFWLLQKWSGLFLAFPSFLRFLKRRERQEAVSRARAMRARPCSKSVSLSPSPSTLMNATTPAPQWHQLVRRQPVVIDLSEDDDLVVVVDKPSVVASQPAPRSSTASVTQPKRSASDSNMNDSSPIVKAAQKWLADAKSGRSASPKFARKADLQQRIKSLRDQHRQTTTRLAEANVSASETATRLRAAQEALLQAQREHERAINQVSELTNLRVAVETCQGELRTLVGDIDDAEQEAASACMQESMCLDMLIAPTVTPLNQSLDDLESLPMDF